MFAHSADVTTNLGGYGFPALRGDDPWSEMRRLHNLAISGFALCAPGNDASRHIGGVMPSRADH